MFAASVHCTLDISARIGLNTSVNEDKGVARAKLAAYRDYLKASWNRITLEARALAKPFLVLTVLLLVGYSSILLANFNYMDDMGRVYEGYKDWDVASRHLSNFLSTFIHGSNFLADASPLPQFLAILAMALAGIIAIKAISDNESISKWAIIAAIPLAINPYFLGCISFKYDAPYMALSVLAAVFPILFLNSKKAIYTLIVFVCTLIMCTTYQASSGIFPMLVILVTVRMWLTRARNKDLGVLFALSCVAYVAGLIAFKLFFMTAVQDYVDASIPPVAKIVPVTLSHLRRFWSFALHESKPIWLILALIIVVSFIYVSIRDSKKNRIASGIASTITVLAMAAIAFGVYPLFNSPIYEVRTMYGAGALIAFLSIVVATSKSVIPQKIVIVTFSWLMVVFSFVYGNALYMQSQWIDFRITTAIESLSHIEAFSNDDLKEVQITGNAGFSPVVENEFAAYPVLERMVPRTFHGDDIWGREGFLYYYGVKNVEYVVPTSSSASDYYPNLDLPLISESMYQNIYGDGNKFLIELK